MPQESQSRRTSRANRVIAAAQQRAQEGQSDVGVGDILWGMYHELELVPADGRDEVLKLGIGIVPRLLGQFGVEEAILLALEDGKQDQDFLALVIAQAWQFAQTLKHAYLSTEHLFLGLLTIGTGPMVDFLAGHGVTADSFENLLRRALSMPEKDVPDQARPDSDPLIQAAAQALWRMTALLAEKDPKRRVMYARRIVTAAELVLPPGTD